MNIWVKFALSYKNGLGYLAVVGRSKLGEFSHTDCDNKMTCIDSVPSVPELSSDFMHFMTHDRVQAWGVHDCHARAFYMNEHSLWLYGLPQHYKICGKRFTDIPAPIFARCSEQIVEQNNICIREKKEITVLNVHPGGSGWFAYVSRKKPHYNSLQQVDGVLSHGYSVTQSWMKAAMNIRCLMKLDGRARGQSSFRIGAMPSLSPRESEVLFFLICNQQIKQIAGILSLSENTIRSHIEHLKKKFGVHSITQLIEAAISVGCHDFLPPTLRLRQLSMIMTN
ncbi:helix-turn-helix transcriptional regulator [Endozoicomonas sp. 4G]|uniref:helix-turn-helix transcriptional regulator n=1 Tax=Endozoicomonas sp. 4G TaxID=2872754 RepID=UPI0020790CFE|nr:helix-turn-helix transcriptional regulator [Endozoicomonas sp. 4G]